MRKYLLAVAMLAMAVPAIASPMDEQDATSMCEKAAKLSSRHPSTVSFSRFWDYVSEIKGDNLTIWSAFTAKNSFGAELKFDIVCKYVGQKMTVVKIREAVE